MYFINLKFMERVARIELAYSAWKADVLPMNYTRILWSEKRDSNPQHPPWQGGALPIEPFPQVGADKGSRTPTS